MRMLCVGAVTEVEPGNIHAPFNEFDNDVRRLGGRSERRDDLGLPEHLSNHRAERVDATPFITPTTQLDIANRRFSD
jgi:hypothetical protein